MGQNRIDSEFRCDLRYGMKLLSSRLLVWTFSTLSEPERWLKLSQHVLNRKGEGELGTLSDRCPFFGMFYTVRCTMIIDFVHGLGLDLVLAANVHVHVIHEGSWPWLWTYGKSGWMGWMRAIGFGCGILKRQDRPNPFGRLLAWLWWRHVTSPFNKDLLEKNQMDGHVVLHRKCSQVPGETKLRSKKMWWDVGSSCITMTFGVQWCKNSIHEDCDWWEW